MFKYLMISITLHLLILLPLKFSSVPKKPVEVEVSFRDDLKGQNTSTKNEEIITFSGTGNIKLRDFFWGVGVLSPERYNALIPDYFGKEVYTYVVYIVYEGYGAYLGGVKPDDVIYEIDGQMITPQNDLRGSGPKQLALTI